MNQHTWIYLENVTLAAPNDRAASKMDETNTKVVCLFLLLIDSVIFGWLPYLIIKKGGNSPRAVDIRTKTISYLNCFAGGVFLGATLLHMMAEGRETMADYFTEAGIQTDFPVYEAAAGLGIFLIAGVEMVAHKMLHKAGGDKKGATNEAYECSVGCGKFDGNNQVIYYQKDTGIQTDIEASGTGSEIAEAVVVCEQASPLKAFLLLGALSFHTVFDGLAVGLKETSSDIWEICTAIIIHKTLVAVCLGLQLFLVYKDKVIKAFLWVFVFSAIAPFGVLLGIIITSGEVDKKTESLTSAILQATATGTFFYVTFFEILKEEFTEKRGFWRIVLGLLGFGAMALAKYFDKD